MKNFNLILFLLILTSCNLNMVDIDQVKMCAFLIDNQCLSDISVFSPSTKEIFISCQLHNAPENTNVKFTWYYLGRQKIEIDAVRLNSGDQAGTLHFQSSLTRPNNGWPTGAYLVSIQVMGEGTEPTIKKFNVK